MDKHLDSVEDLATRIHNLIDSTDKREQVDERKVITKRLQKCLQTIDEAHKALVGRETDAPRLKLHDEQLQDYKRELADIDIKLFSLDLDTDKPVVKHTPLE